MTSNQWNAVTVNLGGAGPLAGNYRTRAEHWAQRVISGISAVPDVVFAQEIPGDGWLDVWREAGYRVIESAGKKYRARSAVLLAGGIEGDRYEFATSGYHGSYVAAARAEHPALGDIVLISVHASPAEVSAKWAETWTACGLRLPEEYRGALWDSDLVLETVRRTASGPIPVVAAGDWNEARRWDDAERGTTGGAAFFERVSAFDLVDVCCPGGEEGDPTHRPEQGNRRALHIDHVLATPGVTVTVRVPKPSSDERLPDNEWPADHRPVEFWIG